MNEAQLARFMAYVHMEPLTGCWLWVGSTNGAADYGKFYLDADHPKEYAHVVSYEHFIGAVPDGKELDHKCRVHCCCCPDHVEPVSHAENMARSKPFRVKSTHCKNGHRLDGENLRIAHDHGRQYRACRACARDNMARYKAVPGNLGALRAYWRERNRKRA